MTECLSPGLPREDVPIHYEIAGWRFDPAEPILRGVEGERRLEDRAARVLALLCEHRGEVVSKERLIRDVWGGRTVSENSVSIVMGGLRRALGDDPGDPSIIVTVARRGYRLVEPDASMSDLRPAGPTRSERFVSRNVSGWIAAATLMIVLACVLLAFRPAQSLTLSVEPPRNATGQHALDALTASLAPVVVHGAGSLHGITLIDDGADRQARVIIRSTLILWNGAPELALRAIDTQHHTVIWSSFASGPPAILARHVEERIRTLQTHLPR